MRLRVDGDAGPQAGVALPVIASGGTWRMFAHDGGTRIDAYAPPVHGDRPLAQIDLDVAGADGVIRFDPDITPLPLRAAPLASPLGELLLMRLVGQRCGLYVHASAVVAGGSAHVFLGSSGAGKTTIASLYERQGATILSDDRTVLFERDGQLFAAGTPFHGKGLHWSPRIAPVRSLLFLEHAPATSLQRLHLGAAASRLAAVSFMELWSPGAIARSLFAGERACRLAPTFALRFRPDVDALTAMEAAIAA